MSARPAPSAFALRLGKALAEQRLRHGFTQEELAEHADLSLRYLGDIERGRENPTLAALERLATSLEWDPWELFSAGQPPIAARVHDPLLAALGECRDRLVATIDWLMEFHPTARAPGKRATRDRPDGSAGRQGPRATRQSGPSRTADDEDAS